MFTKENTAFEINVENNVNIFQVFDSYIVTGHVLIQRLWREAAADGVTSYGNDFSTIF